MKFKDLKEGDKFTFGNNARVYTKIQDAKKTCCSPKANATFENGKRAKFIKPETELILYVQEPLDDASG